MNVKLNADLDAYVAEKIKSGEYASADELFEAALLELRNRETGELDSRWLNAKIHVGLASLELEGGVPADEAMRRVRQYAEYRTAKAKR